MIVSFEFQIELYMDITNINSLDIVSGKLLCPGYLVASWTDDQLVWNISDFNDLEQMSLTIDDIWVPSLVQFGATDAVFDLNPVWVNSNGTVYWIMAGLFEALCKLDIRYYPGDEHHCVFEILPATTDASEIKLTIASVNHNIEDTIEHGEWEIKNSYLTIHEFTEPVSGKTFVTLLKKMTIARRYLFTFVHTCLPLILLCALNTAIFIVPLKSGERISFSTSILLNFVIFTSSMSDDLPHNSLRLPFFSIFMTVANVITTLGVIISVILCRMDYETVVPLPETLKGLAARMLEFRLRKWKPKSSNGHLHKSKRDVKDEDEISTTESVAMGHTNQEDPNMEITWSVFAELIDKAIFYFNFILVLVICLVFSNLMIN